MEIKINIDIEAIVREEIRQYVREHIVINNVNEVDLVSLNEDLVKTAKPPAIRTPSKLTRSAVPPVGVRWEYAAQSGKRRTPEDIALHEQEIQLGRNLTPEEKGQAKAFVELDETAEAKAKEDTIKKVRIDALAEEGMEAAAQELAKEEEGLLSGGYPENPITPVVVVPAQASLFDTTPAPTTEAVTVGGTPETDTGIPKTEDLENIDHLFKN